MCCNAQARSNIYNDHFTPIALKHLSFDYIIMHKIKMCLLGDFRHFSARSCFRCCCCCCYLCYHLIIIWLSNRKVKNVPIYVCELYKEKKKKKNDLITYPNAGHFNTNMKHLTVCFCIRIISAKNFIATRKICSRHIL